MKKAVFISIFALSISCKQEEPITQSESSEQPPAQSTTQDSGKENSRWMAVSTSGKVKRKTGTVKSFVEKDSNTAYTFSIPEPVNNFYGPNQSPAQYLSSLYTPQQAFAINSSEFNTIIGLHGTMLQLPPSTFMINDSTPYDGQVIIELREVLSKAQMVFANFSTTSGGAPLESAGMIYWNATTEDGKQLQMDSGTLVSLTLPGRLNAKDYQLFRGNVSDGMMNWTLFPTPAISLPIAIISHDYFQYKRYKVPGKVLKAEKNLDPEWNNEVVALASGRYQNTQLSTREFLRRLERMKWMGWNSTVLDFYMANPNDLHAADSLAMIQMAAYATNIKESSFVISKKYFAGGAGKKKWIRENTKAFRKFYQESKCYDQQIFVSAKELRWKSMKQLSGKGIDTQYALWLMRPVSRHKQVGRGYELIDAPRDLNSNAYVAALNSGSTNLRIPSMGYINCDRFIESPRKEDVMVQIENYSEMESVSSMIILKNINSVMSGANLDGLFTFKNVPSNYKMYWVVIGSRDEKLYYTSREISPNEIPTGIEKAILKPTTVEELEKAINTFSG